MAEVCYEDAGSIRVATSAIRKKAEAKRRDSASRGGPGPGAGGDRSSGHHHPNSTATSSVAPPPPPPPPLHPVANANEATTIMDYPSSAQARRGAPSTSTHVLRLNNPATNSSKNDTTTNATTNVIVSKNTATTFSPMDFQEVQSTMVEIDRGREGMDGARAGSGATRRKSGSGGSKRQHHHHHHHHHNVDADPAAEASTTAASDATRRKKKKQLLPIRSAEPQPQLDGVATTTALVSSTHDQVEDPVMNAPLTKGPYTFSSKAQQQQQQLQQQVGSDRHHHHQQQQPVASAGQQHGYNSRSKSSSSTTGTTGEHRQHHQQQQRHEEEGNVAKAGKRAISISSTNRPSFHKEVNDDTLPQGPVHVVPGSQPVASSSSTASEPAPNRKTSATNTSSVTSSTTTKVNNGTASYNNNNTSGQQAKPRRSASLHSLEGRQPTSQQPGGGQVNGNAAPVVAGPTGVAQLVAQRRNSPTRQRLAERRAKQNAAAAAKAATLDEDAKRREEKLKLRENRKEEIARMRRELYAWNEQLRLQAEAQRLRQLDGTGGVDGNGEFNGV